MRKNRRDFHTEVTHEPYELDLENPAEDGPAFVTFLDPGNLDSDSAFDLARLTDPQRIIQRLLSDKDYDAWWAEWRSFPIRETNELLEDVLRHYGAEPGKQLR